MSGSLSTFLRSAVQEVVRAVDAEGMEARLKCGDAAFLASECQGAGEVTVGIR